MKLIKRAMEELGTVNLGRSMNTNEFPNGTAF
ncbi:hypothetical protein LR69_04415 [Geobacillus sp. BCO2]|nr:hypothetical protein LR69_04415 [Geobacillus sp. BCO2]